MDFGVVIPVADEGVAQLESCLGFLRAACPDAPAIVISDGVDDPDYESCCRRHGVAYRLDRYLKRIECGGAWWRRLLEAGLDLGRPWLVCIDPDTRVWRPFAAEPAFPIAGTVDHPGRADENVLGGCRAIHADAARRLLASPLLADLALQRHQTFTRDQATRRHWVAGAFMGADMSLAWLARNLGIPWGDWPEVAIRWQPPAPANPGRKYAATHPHKLEAAPAFTLAPLRVITTCKDRLDHLKRTLPRWAAEPGVAVTVVDYDCPAGTAAWVREHHPEVTVVRVEGVPRFHLARARNIGAAASPLGWWCFFDADLLLAPGWAPRVRAALRHRRYLLASPLAWDQFGSVVVHSWDFHHAGGYDEVIKGWGAEDGDFYSRLRHNGIRPGTFPGELAAAIQHDDESRVRHYDDKEKRRSQRIFEVYHHHKVSWMLEHDRIPDRAECHRLLSDACVSQADVPAFYPLIARGDPPKITVLPGLEPAGLHPGPEDEPVPEHSLANCHPRGDRVVVRVPKPSEEARTESGLILPASAVKAERAAPQVGFVVSMGPGLAKDGAPPQPPPDLAVGDKVLFARYAGASQDPELGAPPADEDYFILREEDVLASWPQA